MIANGREIEKPRISVSYVRGCWFGSTYGSGSSTSFFFLSNWSFDIILKCREKKGEEKKTTSSEKNTTQTGNTQDKKREHFLSWDLGSLCSSLSAMSIWKTSWQWTQWITLKVNAWDADPNHLNDASESKRALWRYSSLNPKPEPIGEC